MVLCGGAQETNYYSMASFDALGAFSIRMDEPTKASRPFDRDRDGLIPSGGAASLVLEDYEHARHVERISLPKLLGMASQVMAVVSVNHPMKEVLLP